MKTTINFIASVHVLERKREWDEVIYLTAHNYMFFLLLYSRALINEDIRFQNNGLKLNEMSDKPTDRSTFLIYISPDTFVRMCVCMYVCMGVHMSKSGPVTILNSPFLVYVQIK